MLGREKPARCQEQAIIVYGCGEKGGTHIGVPSCGLRKRTPSSVTLASWRRETI